MDKKKLWDVLNRCNCKIVYFTITIILLILIVIFCNSKMQFKLEYIGYFLILGVIIFTLYYSFYNRITFKKGAITSLIILFISLILIFDEIRVDGLGLLKKAKSDSAAIEELRKKMEADASKISELREHLDSIITIDSNGQIQLHGELSIGPAYYGLNPGIVMTKWMNISSDSKDGKTHGMVLAQIGGYNMITVTRDSDGAGNSDTPRVSINGVLELAPQSTAPTPAKKGLIYFDLNDNKLKVYDGSSWKSVTND